MLRTTWADESSKTRQTIKRTVWTDVEHTDPARGVIKAVNFPTVDGYMKFVEQIYSGLVAEPIHPDDVDLPASLQRVAVGARPLIIEWRWMRHGAAEGDATGYGSLPVTQWAWDRYISVGGATAMWMQTFVAVPVSFQIRYRGGPATYELGNRVGKAWEDFQE